MNPSHYPDLERCSKLTSLGFPKTEKSYGLVIRPYLDDGCEVVGYGITVSDDPIYVCPSVMEMWDVIPEEIEDRAFVYSEGFGYVDCLGQFVVKPKGNVPNALADLIIWLVENGHITFDKR